MSRVKRGGTDKLILVVVIFILFIGFLSSFIVTKGITGFQTINITSDSVKQDLQSIVDSTPMINNVGNGASMCTVVNLNNGTYLSYDLKKTNNKITINENEERCDEDFIEEDFVFQIVSPDALKRIKDDPSCVRFITKSAGQDFYYNPSKFVKQGGKSVCNSEFKKNYCPAINQCSGVPINEFFPCCSSNPFVAYTQGNTWIFFIALVAGVIGILGGVFFFIEKKPKFNISEEEKQQLSTYISSMEKQGYIDAQIKEQLRSQGWPESTLNRFFPKQK